MPSVLQLWPSSKPTLSDLIHLLRTPKEWPPTFTWHFPRVRSCAIGLIHQKWPEHFSEWKATSVGKAFGLTEVQSEALFYGLSQNGIESYPGGVWEGISPTDVADLAEEFLEEKAAK